MDPSGKVKNSPAILRLYNLIRTLTWTQKRVFKKFVRLWGMQEDVQRYVRLFDAYQYFIRHDRNLDDLAGFLLSKRGFGSSPKDITNLCKYLYDRILESMRAVPESSPRFVSLQAKMQDISFLYHKNLFPDCRIIISEAQNLASEMDHPGYELELNLWEKRLSTWRISNNENVEFEEWLQKQQELFAKQQNITVYEGLAHEIREHTRRNKSPNTFLETKLLSLYANYESGLIDTLSVRSKISAFAALADYFYLKFRLNNAEGDKTDQERSFLFRGKVIRLFRENKNYRYEEHLRFANELDNYLNQCLVMGRHDILEQLETELMIEYSGLIKYRNVAYQKMQYYLSMNEFQEAKEYFEGEKIAAGIEKYQHRIVENRLLAIYFTAGQVYYALDDFDRAGNWFANAAGIRTEVRPAEVVLCKILEIICLWEYGAYTSDPTRPIHNLRRILKRAKLLSPVVKDILAAVETVFRHPQTLGKTNLEKRLESLKGKNLSKNIYYLAIVWLEARLYNTSINKEILKFEPS